MIERKGNVAEMKSEKGEGGKGRKEEVFFFNDTETTEINTE